MLPPTYIYIYIRVVQIILSSSESCYCCLYRTSLLLETFYNSRDLVFGAAGVPNKARSNANSFRHFEHAVYLHLEHPNSVLIGRVCFVGRPTGFFLRSNVFTTLRPPSSPDAGRHKTCGSVLFLGPLRCLGLDGSHAPQPFLEYRHLEHPVDVSFVSTVFFFAVGAFLFFWTTFFVAFVFTTANFLLSLFFDPGGRPLGRFAASFAFFLAAEIPLGILGVSGSHLPHPRGDHRHFEHPAVFNTNAMELSPLPVAAVAAARPRRLGAAAATALDVAAAFRFLPAFSMSGGLKIFGGFTSRFDDRAFLMLLFLLVSLDDCKALFLPTNFRRGMANERGRTPEFASSMLFSLSPTSKGCVVSISSSSSSLSSSSLSPFRNIFSLYISASRSASANNGGGKTTSPFRLECIGRRLKPGVAEYTTIGDGLSSNRTGDA